MDILLVGNYTPDAQQSMQRYADMLQSELARRGHRVELIKPAVYLGRFGKSGSALGKWLGYIDKFVIFPERLRREAVRAPGRIVHICDHSNAMYVGWLQDVPHIVTCHDVLAIESALGIHPQNPTKWAGRRLQNWILKGLRRARYIVCVSEATRSRLLALSAARASASITIHNALNYDYVPMSDGESVRVLAKLPDIQALGPRGYVFHIGGNQWYKNREGVLRIYFEYVRLGGKLPLLMAGKPFTAGMEKLLNRAPAGARVLRATDVNNETLNALYARAECLLFPSLEEGFGWPVLEALSVGCPVVCSKRASLPEVGGVCADYIDPDDEASAALALLESVRMPEEKRVRRREEGIAHVRKFSLCHMGDDLIKAYAQISE